MAVLVEQIKGKRPRPGIGIELIDEADSMRMAAGWGVNIYAGDVPGRVDTGHDDPRAVEDHIQLGRGCRRITCRCHETPRADQSFPCPRRSRLPSSRGAGSAGRG